METILNIERPKVSFPTDANGLMEFTKSQRGQFRNDWIGVGTVGMDIHFIVVSGPDNHRQVMCASLTDRRPYRKIAEGYCSLKDCRQWCTDNAQAVSDVTHAGWFYAAAHIESSSPFIRRPSVKLTPEQREIRDLELEVLRLEKAIVAARKKMV